MIWLNDRKLFWKANTCIGPCLINSCNSFSKTVGIAFTGTGSELAPDQRSVVPVAVTLSSCFKPSSTVQTWRVALQIAAHSVLWPWATHIRKYFAENLLIRLFEKWVTPNYSKTKDIKVRKVRIANNSQSLSKMATTPVQTGLQRLMRHTAKGQYQINSKPLVFTSTKSC